MYPAFAGFDHWRATRTSGEMATIDDIPVKPFSRDRIEQGSILALRLSNVNCEPARTLEPFPPATTKLL